MSRERGITLRGCGSPCLVQQTEDNVEKENFRRLWIQLQATLLGGSRHEADDEVDHQSDPNDLNYQSET